MDRKEALKQFIECKEMGYLNLFMPDIPAMEKAIEALQEPEIVHCKDCKLRKLEECAMQYECDCGEQHSWENDNDYCSWGIKAGEQE